MFSTLQDIAMNRNNVMDVVQHNIVEHVFHLTLSQNIFTLQMGENKTDNVPKPSTLSLRTRTTSTSQSWNPLTLRGHGVSMYSHIHNLYGLHKVWRSHLYIYICKYIFSCVLIGLFSVPWYLISK